MIILQLSFSFLYGFLINVQSMQFNVASTVVTIGIAMLVVPGNILLIKGLDYFLAIRDAWYGVGSDSPFLSQLFASKHTHSSMIFGPKWACSRTFPSISMRKIGCSIFS